MLIGRNWRLGSGAGCAPNGKNGSAIGGISEFWIGSWLAFLFLRRWATLTLTVISRSNRIARPLAIFAVVLEGLLVREELCRIVFASTLFIVIKNRLSQTGGLTWENTNQFAQERR